MQREGMPLVACLIRKDGKKLIIDGSPAFFPIIRLMIVLCNGAGAKSGKGKAFLIIALPVAIPGIEFDKGIPEIVILAIKGFALLVQRESLVVDLVEPHFTGAWLGTG